MTTRTPPNKPARFNFQQYKHEWLLNPRRDVLAGVVVALALIPEAIAFSIIAGVDPAVGLYASFIIAMVIAFIGGRPGMISAATGAMALLMTGLVKDHGLAYLFAATILTGVLQIVFGWARLARYLKFVPRSVMVGFVNALAILIFSAQLPQFVGANWQMYAMVAAGLAIIYLLPRVFKAVPSALVAIVALTLVSVFTGANVKTVGDMGVLPTSLPPFGLPQVPLTLETLGIIFPVALTLSLVGLLESLLTAQLVDERTDTTSDKNVESRGQGVANIVTGFFGGMAGCAMIGQSMINVTNGGRGRLSTFVAGAFLLLLILVLQPLLVQIPMAALVAVMIVVSVSTFDWSSLRTLRVFPKSESIVMLSTVAMTVLTRNLSLGVLVGVVLSALFFARKISQLSAVTHHDELDGSRIYHVSGQLFFVSTHDFVHQFDFVHDAEQPTSRITIDLTHAHFWDGSAVGALDKVMLKYQRLGVPASLVGLNDASATLIERLAVHDKPGALSGEVGH
ncbi:SulP family inorganic anion transporter (plasmid) [Deinococcus psychrotolerans]|uniref:SulP family inorganic anion transporter n=1 Tax=Deinococcus psychrotolerans TaxID=2489213 RepID=A0A3G8YI65_9DEIO|nr:SulP family inorganic anion transporter [Deinococcus psychrotolerans]AZI44673.1 SulP family inorganic anion transporter [Deinococcus psychrotolerans]